MTKGRIELPSKKCLGITVAAATYMLLRRFHVRHTSNADGVCACTRLQHHQVNDTGHPQARLPQRTASVLGLSTVPKR